MQKPLIIGMGPNGKYPSLAWHPNAPSTAILCFLALGEWAALDKLESYFLLRNLNNLHCLDGKADGVSSSEASRHLYKWVNDGVLSNERDVILLGKDVTRFISIYFNAPKLCFNPWKNFSLKGTIQDSATLDGPISYNFTAHVLWHPAYFARRIGQSNKNITNIGVSELNYKALRYRDVLARLAKLDETTMLPFSEAIRPAQPYNLYSYEQRVEYARRFNLPIIIPDLDFKQATQRPYYHNHDVENNIQMGHETLEMYLEMSRLILQEKEESQLRFQQETEAQEEAIIEINDFLADHERNKEEGWFHDDDDYHR